VTGSVVGLGVVAVLSGPLGLGQAIAVLGITTIGALAIVAFGFPETARLELEETSGEEAGI